MKSNTELISMLADKAGSIDLIWHYLATLAPLYGSSEGNRIFADKTFSINFNVVRIDGIFIGFKVRTSEKYSHNEYNTEVTSLILDSICECEPHVISHTTYKPKEN